MLILDSLNELPGVEFEIQETNVIRNMKGDRIPYHVVRLTVNSVESQGAHSAMVDMITRLDEFVRVAKLSLELDQQEE